MEKKRKYNSIQEFMDEPNTLGVEIFVECWHESIERCDAATIQGLTGGMLNEYYSNEMRHDYDMPIINPSDYAVTYGSLPTEHSV
jgi:hypothetical protein